MYRLFAFMMIMLTAGCAVADGPMHVPTHQIEQPTEVSAAALVDVERACDGVSVSPGCLFEFIEREVRQVDAVWASAVEAVCEVIDVGQIRHGGACVYDSGLSDAGPVQKIFENGTERVGNGLTYERTPIELTHVDRKCTDIDTIERSTHRQVFDVGEQGRQHVG